MKKSKKKIIYDYKIIELIGCHYCKKAIEFIKKNKYTFQIIKNIPQENQNDKKLLNHLTFPKIFKYNKKNKKYDFIGGYDDLFNDGYIKKSRSRRSSQRSSPRRSSQRSSPRPRSQLSSPRRRSQRSSPRPRSQLSSPRSRTSNSVNPYTYCGNNARHPDIINGTARHGSLYECMRKGFGAGYYSPADLNFLREYEPYDDRRFYCGNQPGPVLPADYDFRGRNSWCFQKGFAAGKRKKATEHNDNDNDSDSDI